MQYPIFDFFKIKSQICFKVCVDDSLVDPYKSVKIWVLPLLLWVFGLFLCNFWSVTKNSYSSRPLTRNHSYIWFGMSPETLFLVYSVPIFTLLLNDLCLTHF